MYYSVYNCVQNCENENACSENFVKSCSAVVIFAAFESNHTASTDRSIEFLATQTDQSKGDILIDYVLKLFFGSPSLSQVRTSLSKLCQVTNLGPVES